MIISSDEYVEYNEWVKDFIDKHCLYRVPKGHPPLVGKAPNTFYTWQFYLRRGLFNHEFLYKTSKMFLHLCEKEFGSFQFQICGMETASTPMLAGIPLVAREYGLDINAFSVRKNRKDYGLRNWFEGRINDKPIMMIDDLCNSTESLGKTLEILLRNNLFNVLDRSFAIVNKVKKEDAGVDNDHALPEEIKVLYFYSLDDFDLTQPIIKHKEETVDV